MKYYLFIFVSIFFVACANKRDKPVHAPVVSDQAKEIIVDSIDSIIKEANVLGSVLIFDPQKNSFFSNDFNWSKEGSLPASTFKVPNSIIALETGTVENDSTLFLWDGETRSIKNWNQNLIFRDAYRFSCVPCYQKIARKVGVDTMKAYVSKFDYGNMVFDSSSIDVFWLKGESKISQFQQIAFLRKLKESQLPISERTEKLMEKIMLMGADGYRMSGKTGLSMNEGEDIGWFVGFVEVSDQTYYFATKLKRVGDMTISDFIKSRLDVTYRALGAMSII